MSKIIVVCIEPLENRYTGHWHKYLPSQLEKNVGVDVIQVEGEEVGSMPTPGAFLNFTGTTIYKSTQMAKIAKMFEEGKISSGDLFLFTDAWNPTAMMVRYMSKLSGIRVNIVGIWHAGNYDPNDILGQTFEDERWIASTETSLAQMYDLNVFATNYHRDLFLKKRPDASILGVNDSRFFQCGFPMEYYFEDYVLPATDLRVNEKIILFPHRKSPEKNYDMFRELASQLPDYKFIVCQDECKTKGEYHALLRRARAVFSANKQETLGIGMAEGLFMGCVPIVPDRLSYSEMYSDKFKYKSWSGGNNSKELHPAAIRNIIESTTYEEIDSEAKRVYHTYFTGYRLYHRLKELMYV